MEGVILTCHPVLAKTLKFSKFIKAIILSKIYSPSRFACVGLFPTIDFGTELSGRN